MTETLKHGSIRIGVDFGGTKIEVAALDAGGNFLSRVRAPNPGEYEASIRCVCELVARVERDVGCRATIGIGAPGSVSPRTGTIRNANSIWLNGRRFREDLEIALQREVRLANDANCLALSEVVDGAAKNANVAFAVIIGTGCGGGLVVDGRLVEGANGIGAEWGHVALPWPTHAELDVPACWCGQRGCIETWVSGTGLQRDYSRTQGGELTSEQIITAARAGESPAQSALARYINRLGRALAMICNIVDPDTIVLGGGVSNMAELYSALPDVIRAYVFSDVWDARIVPAKWGDSSGVRGAARLW